MNSNDLYDAFREDIVDTALPYLWLEDEAYRYMDAAYRMFVRLTGGISDFTSDATSVTITAGEANSDIHPSILRIMSAFKLSDEQDLTIINMVDNLTTESDDYFQLMRSIRSTATGPVRKMIIGAEQNKARWINVPEVDDEVSMHIYRLPLTHVTDGNHTLSEVSADHHIYLLDWMKHLAYKKQDSETFDKSKSDECEVNFRNYCAQVKAEWERYKHKTRVVQYAGL